MSITEKHINTKGYHWVLAAIFVVGEEAGTGMLALPNAMVHAGLVPGMVLLILAAIFTCYIGYQLAESFTMMTQRWSKYQNVCRKPFGEMAYRAFGPRMRQFVAAMLCLTFFGCACVLMMLAAKNLGIIFDFFFDIKMHKCYIIIIVGVFMWPATMLRSPMHFWQIAVFAAITTFAAVVLLTVGMIHDAPVCRQEMTYPDFDFNKFCTSFGTIIFGFGGHAAYPTFQHDMRKPHLFKKSVYIGYVFICGYYISQSILGYYVYGASVGEASIQSIQLNWVQQTVNIMIFLHVITAMIIIFSPIFQQVEELLKVPHSFGIERFVVRSAIYWLVVFVCLSVPHFGPLLDLIGASTMTQTTLILPALFYLSLQASWNKRQQQIELKQITIDSPDEERPTLKEIWKYNSTSVLLFNGMSLTFGIVGGVLATITSFAALFGAEMGQPCYVDYFRDALKVSDVSYGIVNCCGPFKNITVSGIDPLGYCSLAPQI